MILYELRQLYDNANRPRPKIAYFWRLHEFGKVYQRIIDTWNVGMDRRFRLNNLFICTTYCFDIKVKNVCCISRIRTVFFSFGRKNRCFKIFFCHLRLYVCLLYHQDQISVWNINGRMIQYKLCRAEGSQSHAEIDKYKRKRRWNSKRFSHLYGNGKS